ncbi:hypothetical protein L226DRAFT_355319 [Lentinus tigrinus ALCF2SS1-7]|uniref:uncharacterized protein n=1 Tax=Lentinus tigrinus ALCF2SS1-7 TaxID=1328758 RepID=UPI0011660243|nr:hypothetical protein L226DRAFT_355319 [Lentinus tigrinus ALCF2SS1-7]
MTSPRSGCVVSCNLVASRASSASRRVTCHVFCTCLVDCQQEVRRAISCEGRSLSRDSRQVLRPSMQDNLPRMWVSAASSPGATVRREDFSQTLVVRLTEGNSDFGKALVGDP